MKYLATSQRYLCLWFPNWPIQRLISGEPSYQNAVLLLTEHTNRGEIIRYGNQLSHKLGIRAGMSFSESRFFVPANRQIVVEPIRPDHDLQELIKVALRCERYSFCIGLEEASRHECLLMDVAGISHFFSGEQSLAQQLVDQLSQERLDSRIAIAGTIGSAWVAAHFLAQPQRPALVSSGDLTSIAPLPIEGLRLSDTILAKLCRVGMKSIGQVLSMDRAALIRRFGPPILQRVDQLTGRQPESITPCRPLPKYEVTKALEEGISHPQTIEQLWSVLLRALLSKLQPNQLGTRRIEGQFSLEGRPCLTFIVRLCDSLNDFKHISDLFRLQLEKLPLAAPVTSLSLEALEVSPLGTRQRAMFGGKSASEDRSFSLLLNRLSSRLGERAVTISSLLPSAIPEQAVKWSPATDHSLAIPQGASQFHPGDRPTILFPLPRAIRVIANQPEGPPSAVHWQGTSYSVTAAWGPERIEAGWWQAEYTCRDYFRIKTDVGHWWWIFRRLQDGCWFWHGKI